MRLLYYTESDYLPGRIFERMLLTWIKSGSPGFCRGIDTLRRCLQQPAWRPDILLLFPPDTRHLFRLHALHPRLEGIDTILILPDGADARRRPAFCLHPRFICHAGRLSTVQPVMERMMARSERRLAGQYFPSRSFAADRWKLHQNQYTQP